VCVVSVDEPDSVELDSDLDHDDEPDCDAGDISPCASPAEDLEPSTDAATDHSAGVFSAEHMDASPAAAASAGDAAAAAAVQLLPSAMTMAVARIVEDESASSGRLLGWRCDSCNFLSGGLSATCELCSAPRGSIPSVSPLAVESTVAVGGEASPAEQRDRAARAQADGSHANRRPKHARGDDSGGVSIDLTGDSPTVAAQDDDDSQPFSPLLSARPTQQQQQQSMRQALAPRPLHAGGESAASGKPKRQKRKRQRIEIEAVPSQPPQQASMMPGVVVTRVSGSTRVPSQIPSWAAASGNGSAALDALRGSGPAAKASAGSVSAAAAGKGASRKQPDRRKAASDFKNGLGPLPPVTLSMDDTVPAREVQVGGVDGSDGLVVQWPRDLRPSRPQLQLMRHAAAALAVGRHALLESPTGVIGPVSLPLQRATACS
jgi:hypothetical protein